MDETTFWSLIDRARGARAGQVSPRKASADPERLQAILSRLPDDEVAAFGQAFARQMDRLNRWTVWGAAYVINGGASEDGFLYFCEWLVGKGSAAVAQAVDDPDGLVRFVGEDDEGDAENEGLGSAASEVLEARGIEADTLIYPDGPPLGEPFDEATVYGDYPKLARRFG